MCSDAAAARVCARSDVPHGAPPRVRATGAAQARGQGALRHAALPVAPQARRVRAGWALPRAVSLPLCASGRRRARTSAPTRSCSCGAARPTVARWCVGVRARSETWYRASLAWQKMLPAACEPGAGGGQPGHTLVVAHNNINQALLAVALQLPVSFFRRLVQCNAAVSRLHFTPAEEPGQPPEVCAPGASKSCDCAHGSISELCASSARAPRLVAAGGVHCARELQAKLLCLNQSTASPLKRSSKMAGRVVLVVASEDAATQQACAALLADTPVRRRSVRQSRRLARCLPATPAVDAATCWLCPLPQRPPGEPGMTMGWCCACLLLLLLARRWRTCWRCPSLALGAPARPPPAPPRRRRWCRAAAPTRRRALSQTS